MCDSPITIWLEGTTSSVHDSSPTIEFDAATPRKVTVKPTSTSAVAYGYKLLFDTGAFHDVAQNARRACPPPPAKSGTYMVKSTARTGIPFVQYPLPGTVNNVTKYEDMVFDFGTNPVVASP